METLQHHTGSFTQGIIICGIGFFLCYVVGRRRFNRRGIGGLQQYHSYGTAIITTLLEKLVKFIGIILLLIGLWLTINSKSEESKQAGKHKPVTTINNHPKK
jgi:hypothetical protein